MAILFFNQRVYTLIVVQESRGWKTFSNTLFDCFFSVNFTKQKIRKRKYRNICGCFTKYQKLRAADVVGYTSRLMTDRRTYCIEDYSKVLSELNIK
jgi:hypothetical protein